MLLHALPLRKDIPQVSAKLRYLESQQEKVDVIFLGSSRVRRQIPPDVFDAEMALRGHHLRSLNLGIDAMTFPELGKFTQEVLDRRPPGLKYIIVDLNVIRRVVYPADDATAPRSIWWHDWRHTSMVLRDLAQNPEPLPSKSVSAFDIAVSHSMLMLGNSVRLGEGAVWMKETLVPKEEESDTELAQRGYHPEEGEIKASEEKDYMTRLEEMKSGNITQLEDPVQSEAYRDYSRLCEQCGVKIVFVMMPIASRRRPPLPPADVIANHYLLEFDNPTKYPLLYAKENRYDAQHVNNRGATILTRLIAGQLADRLAN